MKWLGTNKPYDQYHRDEMMEDLDKVIAYAKQLVKNCNTPAVVGRSEQLVSFLRQYQKACEIMHVHKIDAKNFVEQYKTN